MDMKECRVISSVEVDAPGFEMLNVYVLKSAAVDSKKDLIKNRRFLMGKIERRDEEITNLKEEVVRLKLKAEYWKSKLAGAAVYLSVSKRREIETELYGNPDDNT